MPKTYVSLHDVAPPHLALVALEMRAFWEFGAVVPTWPLRKYLNSLGYTTEGWNQGLNLEPRPGVLEAARQQITDTFKQAGSKVSLRGCTSLFTRAVNTQ